MHDFPHLRLSKRSRLPAFFALEYEERLSADDEADAARDRQIAWLHDAVMQLMAAQKRTAAALARIAKTWATADAEKQMILAERMAEVHRLAKAARIDDEFIREFQEGYDSAERRKQELKARIRQMDLERRARFTASF